MVSVNSDEDDLDACVNAAHAELNWMLDKKRAKVFAEHR